MEALGAEWSEWLESAESAGWGDQPLPGFSVQDAEQETVSRVKRHAEEEPEARLGPYLDALRTGGVGSRRTAAEGLQHAVADGDEPYLLAELARAPEGMRFALCAALGAVGTPAALEPLLALLEDPFAQREAADAASLIATRAGTPALALLKLREPGLCSTWRWVPRARLGDEAWTTALVKNWTALSQPLRIQALDAGALLPPGPKAALKASLRSVGERAGGQLQKLWEAL
jgi:hypothetical protein